MPHTTCSQDLDSPPSRRKFYRRDDGVGLGVFGEDSEEEGDHASSYDGPASNAEDYELDQELDEWDREREEAEMEAQYLRDKDEGLL